MKLSKVAKTRVLSSSVALMLSASVYAESSDVLEEIIVTADSNQKHFRMYP